MNKVRVKLGQLPDLPTGVSIAGSVKHQEVGGAVCASIALGIALWVAV